MALYRVNFYLYLGKKTFFTITLQGFILAIYTTANIQLHAKKVSVFNL